MRARVNPFFEPVSSLPVDRARVRAFHRSLPGYAPTPLWNLRELAASLELGSLYLKDESQRFGLQSFKVLGASWALHRLREQRHGEFTVATATDGNHGRAVAWAAQRLGLPAVIFIPAYSAPARVENIRREGARVELVPGNYDDAVSRCAEESEAHGWQVIADTGYDGYLEIPHWITEGYSTLYSEIDEQLEAAGLPPPNAVLIQAGVGSLLQAAVDHFRSRDPQPIMVSVEPDEADALYRSIDSPDGQPTRSPGNQRSIMAGLNCGEVSLAAWPTNRRGVELFITIPDRFAEAAMIRLARPGAGLPAIEAGESGAAGLAGLLALREAPEFSEAARFLDLGSNSRVLVINTEGATDPAGYRRVVLASS